MEEYKGNWYPYNLESCVQTGSNVRIVSLPHDSYLYMGEMTMRIDVLKKDRVTSQKEFAAKLRETIDNLNETREGVCWICGAEVHNWGVLIPDSPDGLGLGASNNATRLAFFPYCKEHDINDGVVVGMVKEHLELMKQTLSN